MKNKLVLVVFILSLFFLSAAVFVINKYQKSKPKSKIIVPVTEVSYTNDGKTVVKIPLAKLPKPENIKNLETLEGKVVLVANNPESADTTMRISLLVGSEIIILANGPYVNTLRNNPVDKDVVLKGKWKKDAVINGKRHRTFWIEDIQAPVEK